MKTSSKMAILLSALLIMSILTNVGMAFAASSSDLANVVKPNAALVTDSQDLPVPLGAAGSGWKPDVPVASSADNEFDPSMGSYIDPGTGAVALYVAYVSWHDRTPFGVRWEGRIARSTNRGATWSGWWSFWWSGAWSIRSPSLVVNAYNNTVFVATESYPMPVGNYDIDVWRFTSTSWRVDSVDTADNNRFPSLTIEYSYATNYLFVSYEKVTTWDDEDLYVARSTNWGITWTTELLRGGALDTNVYHQSDATYAQGNVYIAYRHSTDETTTGHIDVSYSTDYGATWKHVANASKVPNDASWPSIAGSRIGDWHKPMAVIVVYQYATTATNDDLLYAWTDDYGATWDGGSDYYHQIAVSATYERYPQVVVDGMGTESTNVGGNFHIVYWKGLDAYYTQLPYWDIPDYYGGPYAYWGYYLGWSSPHGLINDAAAYGYPWWRSLTIAAYTKTVGGETLWEPGVAWIDSRNFNLNLDDIYYSTPGTDFSITFVPSSQSVVAGKSISYYVTVNLLAGPATTAYLGGTVHYPVYQSWLATMAYSVGTVTPTGTSTLTVDTSHFMPPGAKQLAATATIGGYRRMVLIPYTVTAPPTLTLNLNPTTVARGALLTISGQLSPAPPAGARTIYIFYRFPHLAGSWALATTLTTNAAGAYSVTATVPVGMTPGQYDLVAFWVNTANGSYAASPIRVLTIT
jgi:hypothetical protein